jgi:hypothetical protein
MLRPVRSAISTMSVASASAGRLAMRAASVSGHRPSEEHSDAGRAGLGRGVRQELVEFAGKFRHALGIMGDRLLDRAGLGDVPAQEPAHPVDDQGLGRGIEPELGLARHFCVERVDRTVERDQIEGIAGDRVGGGDGWCLGAGLVGKRR